MTDRNGIVTRYHYSGRNITKVEQWIAGASAFATDYTYSGGDLITIVKPRGNRIDFTVNGNGFVTERRQKETNTNSHERERHRRVVDVHEQPRDVLHRPARGNTTTYTRDGAGNVTAINFPTVTNPGDAVLGLEVVHVQRRGPGDPGDRRGRQGRHVRVLHDGDERSRAAQEGQGGPERPQPRDGVRLQRASIRSATITDPLTKVTTVHVRRRWAARRRSSTHWASRRSGTTTGTAT